MKEGDVSPQVRVGALQQVDDGIIHPQVRL